MNRAASQLGKLAKGIKKTMTPAAIEARKANAIKARKARWPNARKSKPTTKPQR
jgi:hypothetical protein